MEIVINMETGSTGLDLYYSWGKSICHTQVKAKDYLNSWFRY